MWVCNMAKGVKVKTMAVFALILKSMFVYVEHF